MQVKADIDGYRNSEASEEFLILPSSFFLSFAHGQLPGREGAHGQGKLRTPGILREQERFASGQQRKEGCQELRGEEWSEGDERHGR